MISREDKKKMERFILSRIEDSMRYMIKEHNTNQITITQKPSIAENPATIQILLHNNKTKMTKAKFLNILEQNSKLKTYTANVFYKDNETYMVRLGPKAHTKRDASLKRYNKETRDSIIFLRGIEKIILEQQGKDNMLIYFQPETARLEESLNFYKILTPILDYSHIDQEHYACGFVNSSEEAKAYKIPTLEYLLNTGGIGFKQPEKNKRLLVIKPLDRELAKNNADKRKSKKENQTNKKNLHRLF